jgi:hypothetical protein
VAIPHQSHDRDAHPQRLASGRRAVVGEGVERDVDFPIVLQVIVQLVIEAEHVDPFSIIPASTKRRLRSSRLSLSSVPMIDLMTSRDRGTRRNISIHAAAQVSEIFTRC